jgi:hypothetical protein
MGSVTTEQMIEVSKQHEQAEFFAQDLDMTMATLIANPLYYWYPQRLRIEGYDAVREMYARIMPLIKQMADKQANQNILFRTYGDSQLAAEVEFDYTFPDGTTRPVHIAAFLNFEDGKMVGETQYVDTDLAKILDGLLDDEFRKMPGVTIV